MQDFHDYVLMASVIGGIALKIWPCPWELFLLWGMTCLYLLSWVLLLYDGWRKTGSVRTVIKDNSIELIGGTCLVLLGLLVRFVDSCVR